MPNTQLATLRNETIRSTKLPNPAVTVVSTDLLWSMARTVN